MKLTILVHYQRFKLSIIKLYFDNCHQVTDGIHYWGALCFTSDNVCIDSMSVKINRRILDKCTNNLQTLEKIVEE